MLHRTARLVDHPSLHLASAPLLPPSSLDNALCQEDSSKIEEADVLSIGHEVLMQDLIHKVVERYKDSHKTSPVAYTRENDTPLPQLPLPSSLTTIPPRAVSPIECSAAVTALFACSIARYTPTQHDMHVILSAILADKNQWTHRQIVMCAVSLGRMQKNPMGGAFFEALRDVVSSHMSSFPSSELCTVLRGMSQADFDPGRQFIHSILVTLQPTVPKLHLNDVLQVLHSLAHFSYSPQRGLSNIGSFPMDAVNGHATVSDRSATSMHYSKHFYVHGVMSDKSGGTGAKKGGTEKLWHRTGNNKKQFSSKEQYKYSSRTGKDTAAARQNTRDERSLQFRGLHELQELAVQWERQRRRDLDSWKQEKTESSPLLDVSSLAAKVARARAGKLTSLKFAQEIDSTLGELRKSIQLELQDDKYAPMVNDDEILGEERENEDVLMNQFLSPSTSTSSAVVNAIVSENKTAEGSPGISYGNDYLKPMGRGRRIFRLGKLLAEAKILPENGKLVIGPHYDSSILWEDEISSLVGLPLSKDSRNSTQQQSISLSNGNVYEKRKTGLGSSVKNDFLLSLETLNELPSNILNKVYANQQEDDGHLNAEADDTPLPLHAGDVAAETINSMILHVLDRIPDEKPEALVQIPWFMGVLRHWDEDILENVAIQIESLPKDVLENVADIALAELLWGFASLGAEISTNLVDMILNILLHSQTPDVEHTTRPPDMYCKLAWTLASLDKLTPELLWILSNRFEEAIQASIHQTKREAHHQNRYMDYMQMYQAALHLEVVTKRHHSEFLPEKILKEGAAAWHARQERVRTSKMQRRVASVLGDLGVQCHLEFAPPNSNLVIDIAVTHPSSNAKIAVEVDGPYHFAANAPKHMLGSVNLRNSLLEHYGWRVVSVPFYEWGVLQNNEEEIQYLTQRILSILREQ